MAIVSPADIADTLLAWMESKGTSNSTIEVDLEDGSRLMIVAVIDLPEEIGDGTRPLDS